jgi:uroporphyrinogen-III decarboxylase
MYGFVYWSKLVKVLQASKNRLLLLSTGTGTTPDTTLENQRAMVETVVNE